MHAAMCDHNGDFGLSEIVGHGTRLVQDDVEFVEASLEAIRNHAKRPVRTELKRNPGAPKARSRIRPCPSFDQPGHGRCQRYGVTATQELILKHKKVQRDRKSTSLKSSH